MATTADSWESTQTGPNGMNVYISQMVEVKRRFRAIDRMLGAKKNRTLDSTTDLEFMWLQLRHIIELVAFSAMAADRARYAALRRETQKNPNYQVDWKAGKIFGSLSEISLHALPKKYGEVQQVATQPDVYQITDDGVVATRERLTALHCLAGDQLHARSPFQPVPNRPASREEFLRALGFMRSLLWKHVKVVLSFQEGDSPRDLGDPREAWLIDLLHPENDQVSLVLAVAT